MAQVKTTITQLLELFHQSRLMGEEAKLSMETKDGKDYINFSIGSPSAGSPVETPRRKSSGRRKPPSQIRRDKRRKEIFLAKKNGESLDTKNTSDTTESKEDARIREPTDEIELTKGSRQNKKTVKLGNFSQRGRGG